MFKRNSYFHPKNLICFVFQEKITLLKHLLNIILPESPHLNSFYIYSVCLLWNIQILTKSFFYQIWFPSNLQNKTFLCMYICFSVPWGGCGSEGFSYVTSTFLRVPSFLVVLYFSESSDIVSQVYIIINHLNCFLLLHFLWNLVSISI